MVHFRLKSFRIKNNFMTKQKPKKLNLREYILDLHRKEGSITFNHAMERLRLDFQENYGRRIDTKNESKAAYEYRKLVSDGYLIFEKEDGTAYMSSNLEKLFI